MTTTDDLAGLLLRRRQSVYVPSGAGRSAETDAAVVVLEAELADRGHLLTAPLRRALTALSIGDLAETGRKLIADVDALMGSDRRHAPLLARFPDEVPYQHAYDRFTSVVAAHLAAQPHQPCMNCAGTTARVRALMPCAHLLCDDCHRKEKDWGCCDDCCVWYACQICERRYETDGPLDPWLDTGAGLGGDGGEVLRALRLAAPGDATAELAALLARRTPLNPQDHDDLVLLLGHADPAEAADWLPASIPLRESKALALAPLLDLPQARSLVGTYADTATDVLRILVVRSGGDPDLLEPPRLRGLSRPVRRELLALLDGFGFPRLAEDMARHPRAWQRAGELLHPFEAAGRHARVALAFAVLRGTRLDDSALGEVLLTEAARHDSVRLVGDRLRVVTWQSRVEEALGRWDVTAAAGLLRERPGELLRRLGLLLDRSGAATLPEPVGEALAHALPRTAPGPLLGAYGQLKIRTAPGHRRVFFPRGRVTKAFAVEDHRPPLPARVAGRAGELIEAEAVRRLAAREGERYDVAVLDASLADLPVPFAERASAASLVAVPRGSSLPMPTDSERVRLFLHWLQPKGTRVDLDLSVALYDDLWRFVGLCDYTHLEYARGAARHSGDLTSAPAPHGATEYLDLDLPWLANTGVRFVVPAVLSYNDVPFDELPDAFAGFMAVEAGARAVYDPRTVRQRFDLAGDAKLRVPMIVDLRTRRAWWADVTLATTGTDHDVWRHREQIRRMGNDLLDTFEPRGRATLWDLACWTAAARTDGDVYVRGRGHVLWGYRRAADEPRADFALRVREGWEPDALCAEPDLGGRRALLALLHGELATTGEAASGTVYRLYPGPVDAAPLERITAGGLAAWLAPAA
ncbi:MXAN_6230/SCO0854 family RING domain-containing protein [Streptomyces sp. NRRL S-920]|uniref:MXAN_6230/SCO0854 family RING domain-containing protein n=1 Tax=Streptomyces sp. NRRL S-920 TaxID=1463921 RepID=UPI0004C7B13E|nr:MXAN_6230/SCO0854 family RING domain-containing protein [Streptomyces sp. NRRL S-920]